MLMLLKRPLKPLSVDKKVNPVKNRYARIPKGLPHPHHPMVQMRAELFEGLFK